MRDRARALASRGYRVRDIRLAAQGRRSHEWAREHMVILNNTMGRLRRSRPLRGVTVGFCLHITKETSVLLLAARELGATVAACPGNPMSTQDDIAAFLAKSGVHVYAWAGQTQKEYDACIASVLSHRPSILVDDGADMNVMAHFDRRFSGLKVLGATEETTAGVSRIRAVERAGRLRYPVIVVNDAHTKHLFDNRHGTGQSTVDALLRSANLLVASKAVVVAGYGWVGRGVAARCRGLGARVIVTETDPVRALEAHMDGYEVMRMADAARRGEIFVTCTGQTGVITKGHIESMRDGAILANVGHFDVEIDTRFLLKKSHRVREVRPGMDECTIRRGRRVYLMARGRLANLVAAEGHPPEVMAQSFSNQLLSIIHILKNHGKMERALHRVPESIDVQVARDALAAMGVRIDRLTREQAAYGSSW